MRKVVVIGAGVGGLTAGALLLQAGFDVTVLEAQAYAGGCAGTYSHKGYRFDAGATLAGGFQPNGPHAQVAKLLGIRWPVREATPAWIVHLPDRSIRLDREGKDAICEFPSAAGFMAEQRRLADIAWSMAAHGLPWPPSNLADTLYLSRTGLAHFPGILSAVPFALGTMRGWLARHKLAEDPEFVRFIDAQLLISAQTTSSSANALYGATALDLARQGVYDVSGGIGGIASTLVDYITEHGGRVLFKHRASRIIISGQHAVAVETERGRQPGVTVDCDLVLANLTPWTLHDLLGQSSPRRLKREVRAREPGWGAFVLHLGIEAAKLPHELAGHHQIITEREGPLGEGRSIFVSISPDWDGSRAPDGHRAVTITTHTEVTPWWKLLADDPAAYEARKQAYSEQMLAAVGMVIPGFSGAIRLILPGTPVTYQTFTGRHLGMVGGFPQGSLFAARGPRTGLENIKLVGDSIFPGQSTAGVTLGAIRVVRDILHDRAADFLAVCHPSRKPWKHE